MSLGTLPPTDGNTRVGWSALDCCVIRISTARTDNGTRCFTLAFMRDAGTVHTALVRSTSSHVIPRTSPDLAAVRIRNSNINLLRLACLLWSTSSIKAGTSDQGREGWCTTRSRLLCCLGRSLPTTPTGLPLHISWATHQSMTTLQRCLRREAVSGLSIQIIDNASAKSLAFSPFTSRLPSLGKTNLFNELSHSALCLAFVQPSFKLWYALYAACSKVRSWASTLRAALAVVRALIGSVPLRISSRAAEAALRTSVMLTEGYTPKPMSRRLCVSGDVNNKDHLPCPFTLPGISLKPATVPSGMFLSSGLIFFAFKSVKLATLAPHPALHL